MAQSTPASPTLLSKEVSTCLGIATLQQCQMTRGPGGSSHKPLDDSTSLSLPIQDACPVRHRRQRLPWMSQAWEQSAWKVCAESGFRHLRAPAAKEQVQGLRQIEHLRAPAHLEQVQGLPCQSGGCRRVPAARIGRPLALKHTSYQDEEKYWRRRRNVIGNYKRTRRFQPGGTNKQDEKAQFGFWDPRLRSFASHGLQASSDAAASSSYFASSSSSS